MDGWKESLDEELERAQEVCAGPWVKELDLRFGCNKSRAGKQWLQGSNAIVKLKWDGVHIGIFKEYYYTLKAGPEIKSHQLKCWAKINKRSFHQGM